MSVDLELDLQIASRADDLPSEAQLAQWAAAALEGYRAEAELSVRIVDAEEGRELNRRYRDKDYATNVLSFPVELPAGVEMPLLGDLVICAGVVAREAAEQGKAPEAHWAHLTVHGVLHLLGHDHIEHEDAEVMESLEQAILARLGYPDPYWLPEEPAAGEDDGLIR
ncbi:rRNA maturation RNase YbeY [Ectothiorhodospiraceae bacterium WFHF3C12]|nr:rRNA maturation RNase YbeY [Ectothiorhodospiraceae bacterium WFHF3C12]